MLSEDSLPVILVSVGSEADAAAVISELIDNDVTEEVGASGAAAGAGAARPWRVWRLLNKYYRADVRVWPCVDTGAPVPVPVPVPAHCVDAHVLYLAENECTVEVLERRLASSGELTSRAAVRLVLCAAPRAPAALCAAAAARRLELVLLREPPPPPAAEGPFAELCGPARARAALHAHTWRGLVRLDRPPAPSLLPPDSAERGGDSSDEGGEGEEEEEEGMLRRAEQFAALLEALPGARADAGAGGEARLQRAEALVAAFCRALADDAEW